MPWQPVPAAAAAQRARADEADIRARADAVVYELGRRADNAAFFVDTVLEKLLREARTKLQDGSAR